MWKTAASDPDASKRSHPGHIFEDSYPEHLRALRNSTRKPDDCDAPFDEKRDAAAAYNTPGYTVATLDSVYTDIMTSAKRPNEQRQQFLTHFIRRLKVEYLEKQRSIVNKTRE